LRRSKLFLSSTVVLAQTGRDAAGRTLVAPGATTVRVKNLKSSETVRFSCFDLASPVVSHSTQSSIAIQAVAGKVLVCRVTVSGAPKKVAKEAPTQALQLGVNWSPPANVTVGDTSSYTITLTGKNLGAPGLPGVDAYNVSLTMAVPSQFDVFSLTFVSSGAIVTPPPTCTPLPTTNAGGRAQWPTTVNCSFPLVQFGAEFYFVWSYYAPKDIGSTVNVPFSVSAQMTSPRYQPPPNANDPAQDVKSAFFIITADVTIAISGPTPIIAGDTDNGRPRLLTYVFTVCNSGPSNAPNITSVFQIPRQFSLVQFNGDNCTASNGGYTVTCVGLYLPATSPRTCYDYSQGVRLDGSAVGAQDTTLLFLGNTSSVVFDANTINNGKYFPVDVLVHSDVGITKSGTVLIAAGDPAGGFYQIKVINAGPSTAFNVRMDDIDLPTEFFITGVTTSTPTDVCTFTNSGAGGRHEVHCSFGDLSPLVSAQDVEHARNVNITYSVAADVPPTVYGPVTVTSQNNKTNVAFVVVSSKDTNQNNNQDPHFVDIYAITDLFVQKNCRGSIVSGSSEKFFYTIPVGNRGISNARSVVILDQIPSQFVPTSSVVTIAQASGTSVVVVCDPIVGNLVRCTVDNLPPFSGPNQFTLSVEVGVKAGIFVTTNVTNTANITSSSWENLPVTGFDNSAQCLTTILPPPDLTIVKWAPQAVVVFDATTVYRYTIFVTNQGPTQADLVQVLDTVNSTFVVQTALITPNPGCAGSSGNNVVCNLGSITAGQTVQVVIPFTVPADRLAQTVENCATTSAALESDTTNNRACNSTVLSNGARLGVSLSQPNPCAGASSSVVATIVNFGPAPAASVTFSDTLPTGFTVTGVSATKNGFAIGPNPCVASGQSVSCSFGGNMQTTDQYVVTTVFSVPVDTSAGSYSHTATVSTPTFQTSHDGNTATGSIVVQPCPDLRILKTGATKVFAGTSGDQGQAYLYSLSVGNIGVSTATGVTSEDVLPEFLTATAATATLGGSCDISSVAGNVVTRSRVFCTWATPFAPGVSATVTILFSVSPRAPRSFVQNCATVSIPTGDQNTTNNRDCFTTEVQNLADVAVNKATSATCILSDGTTSGEFTVTVNNRGPSWAYGVDLTDVIETPFTFVPGSLVWTSSSDALDTVSCSYSSLDNTIRCTIGTLRVTTIGSADAVTIKFSVTVARNFISQIGFNTATATSRCSPDVPNVPVCVVNAQDKFAWNNFFTVQKCVSANAVLKIVKSCEPGPVVSGKPGPYSFQIDVVNQGPSDAYSVVVTDVFDSNFVILGQSSTSLSCIVSGQTLTCMKPSLVYLDSARVIIQFRPIADLTSNITVPNTATVTSAQSAPVSSTCNTLIVPPPDIVITKVGPASILIDDVNIIFFYSIVITSNGFGTAENVIFKDTLPNEAVPQWGTLTVTGGAAVVQNCTTSGQFISCAFGNLAQGASISVKFGFKVPQTNASMMTNCANATIDYEIFGGRHNEACNTTTLSRGANLVVTKNSTDVCAGNSGVYSIQVYNAGPASAQMTEVFDQVPSAYSNLVVSSVTTNVGTRSINSCSFTGQLLKCEFAAVPAFEQIVVTFNYSVASTVAEGPVANTVIVNTTTVDLDLSSNNFTRTYQIGNCVTIATNKVAAPTQVVAGGNGYTFVLQIQNQGPSAAVSGSVSLTDTMPLATFDVISAVPSGNATCTVSGSAPTTNEIVSCTWNEVLLPNAARTVTVTYNVLPSQIATTTTNCFFVGSVSACAPVEVITLADMAVTKTSARVCAIAGDGAIAYTVTVANNGPSWAYSVFVIDNVPAEFRYQGQTLNNAFTQAANCQFPAAGSVGGSITCNIPQYRLTNFVSGANLITFVYTVTADATKDNTTGIVNTVAVTSGCSVATCATAPDTIPGNNQANVTSCINAFAEVSATKVLSSSPAGPIVSGDGAIYSFVISVSNNGPSTAKNVTVADTGYAGGTVLSVSSALITANPARGSCDLATRACFYNFLSNGENDVITITFVVPAAHACGTYSNTVGATSSTYDRVPSNNGNTIPVPQFRQHDLLVHKSGQVETVEGTGGYFYFEIRNLGPSIASQVVFTDDVPLPLVVTGVSSVPGFAVNPCQYAGQHVTCSFGDLLPSTDSITFNITYSLAPDATIPAEIANVTNQACVVATGAQSCETEINPINNCDNHTVILACVADLRITKNDGVSQIVAGDGSTYTFVIEVTNLGGPSTGRHIVANDNWPSQYSPLAGQDHIVPVINPAEGFCVVSQQNNFVCNLQPLATNQVVRITVAYRVLASVPAGVAINNVTVTGSCRDVNATNNFASDANTILNNADVGIIKDDCAKEVVAGGESLAFTFTVTNKGPSNARNVVVRDTFPSQYTLIGGTTPLPANGNVVCNFTDLQTFECTYATLDVGVIYYLVQPYHVLESVLPQEVTNCVSFVKPLVVPDPNLIDNEDCDTNNVVTRADLAINKTVTVADPASNCIVAGDTRASTYVVTTVNLGPSVARNVVLHERLPVGIDVLGVPQCLFVPNPIATPCCSRDGATNNFTCTLGDLVTNAGVVISFTFTVNADTDPGIITNYATVASTTLGNVLATFDPELCNNNVTLSSLVCAVSDLSVTKDDGVVEVTAGETDETGQLRRFKYNITGCNNGPSTARRVRFDDLWPLAATGYQRLEIRGNVTCVDTATGFECEAGTLHVGECISICVYYKVLPCALACEACNTVLIESNSRDNNRDNNQAIDCDAVKTRADLNVTKTDGVTRVVAGDQVKYQYTINVCNAGPSCAQQVTLLDHFPHDVERADGLRISNDGSCINDPIYPKNFSCTLLTLQPGQCVTVWANYTVPATAITCSVHNIAIVSSITFDPYLCNNVATDTNALVENATLTIVKNTPTPSIPLDDHSPKVFSIIVTNNGPSVAHDVVVTDIWPHDLCQYPLSISFLPEGAGSAITTGADITATLGDILPHTSKTVIVPFSVCERSQVGVAVNRASAFSPTDSECRDTDVTVTLTAPAHPSTKRVVPVASPVKRSEPLATEVRERTVEAKTTAPAPRANFDLSTVTVGIKTEWVGPSSFTVEVVNPQAFDVRITMVTLLAVGQKGESVAVDVTRVGPEVLRTTCSSFAERRLPHMWSEKCTVHLAHKFISSRVAVSGISQQSDGPHSVSASASL
jgi:uncharacterized repeat protein (TIGR01451 family)